MDVHVDVHSVLEYVLKLIHVYRYVHVYTVNRRVYRIIILPLRVRGLLRRQWFISVVLLVVHSYCVFRFVVAYYSYVLV